MCSKRHCLRALLFFLIVSPGLVATAHDPGAQSEAKGKPDYKERLARMKRMGPHKLGSGLEQRAVFRIRKGALRAAGFSDTEIARSLLGGRAMAFPFSASPELRSLGSVRTLTICIDFNDHRAAQEIPGLTPVAINENLFGAGTDQAQHFAPYESLNAYYRRASLGKVNVQGDVLGWYNFPKVRGSYEPAVAPPGDLDQQAMNDNRAIFKMAVEAMRAFDATHDFAHYDNDNDGDIDLVVLQYAGPDTGWGGFWWAYRWEFFIREAEAELFDGKRLKQFVFSFVNERGNHDFDPSTLIHEFGHSFGLADYYDYDPDTGPAGGVGGLDMMDANRGNHCAFSRWLLDWIQPETVNGPPASWQLIASGADLQSGHRAIAVYPGLAASRAPSQELFLIENRHRLGNDKRLPADGLLIWHVDATVDPSGSKFLYDNSYTRHKLIRLMRADNETDFGKNEPAGAGTYFVNGKTFTPSSKPSSDDNNGHPTGVSVASISDPSETVATNAGVVSVPSGSSEPAGATGPAGSLRQVERTLSAVAENDGSAVNLDEIEDLDRRLSSATPKEIEDTWRRLSSKLADSQETTQAALITKTLLAHWAHKDGKAAVEATLRMSPTPLRANCYALAMHSWADSAPNRAASWYFAPQQKALRQSKDLVAGDGFTEKVFAAMQLSGMQNVPLRIDDLDHVSEIWGAVEGLKAAHDVQGKDKRAFHEALKSVERHSRIVDKLHIIQDAASTVNDSALQPDQRAEINQVIREKLNIDRTQPEKTP